jgi:predicted FMN-binding regulatory protein PaiB
MNADKACLFRHLAESANVLARTTLHRGEPCVSMVPIALSRDGDGRVGLIIHVSELVPHTRDMR